MGNRPREFLMLGVDMADFLPSIFDGLPQDDTQEALRKFKTVHVEPGFRLIEEGDLDSSLVIVRRGECEISTGGTRLGTAGNGDLIGEMALFSNGMRTATVESVTACELLLLDLESYEALRNSGSTVALAIEEHALSLLTDRLRTTGDRIASLAEGVNSASVIPEAGFFDRMASAFGSGGVMSSGRVDGAAVLNRSPLFSAVPQGLLERVAKHFIPITCGRGHFFCREGDQGNDMFIVASGLVDVVVATNGGKIQLLATLEPGDAFGMCSLIQTEHPRMASCVAREKTTCLALSKLKWAELIPYADIVGSVVRVAMIRALADSVAYANAQLSMLDMQRSRAESIERQREVVMRAAAAVETTATAGAEGPSDSLPSYLR